MSQQEMDQMDREVMALVNERHTEDVAPLEELGTEPASPCDDVETSCEVVSGEEKEATMVACTPIRASNSAKHTAGAAAGFWRKTLLEKDGMYCIPKEDFQAIDAAAKRHNKTKNAVFIAVCLVIMGALGWLCARPEMVSYITAAGVVACSVMIGVCLQRMVEVNR